MSEQEKSLLVLSTSKPITQQQKELMAEAITPIANSMGMAALILTDGIEVGIHSDIRPLMQAMIDKQQTTNELLAALVDALAEDGGDPDAPPARYMDGTPVRG